MFSLLDDVVDVGLGVAKVAVDVTLQPVADGLDFLQGMSEGEFRANASLRLGADVVAGMALAELIEVMRDD